ncbi:unnamed protein product [Paramecium octaurelia]|uniref:Serine aminopeptidase S33 domain-containing protein n=1 Tax=Paramecium octaurelia TaxID=43137 RepID=A0A8S1S9S4_PAROT|nr:unnamed protein product [Paramecium octaurelia]
MSNQSDPNRRNQMIQNAVPEEKYRKPNPVGNHKWDEENFINFQVTQKGQGINLATYRCNTTLQQPKSITVFFHGLNEHLGLYAHIAQAVSKQANSVAVGFDFRGFGKSQGVRGWLESREQLENDCIQFIQKIRNLYPDLSLFTLGQSMGGMASYLMGQFNQCEGTILITPAIMDNRYNQSFMKSLGLIFGACCPTWNPFPPVRQPGSRNPQIQEDNLKDPYCTLVAVLPGTGRTLVSTMRSLPQTFSSYKKPFLVITAGMDKVVDPNVGQELMKQSPSLDKQIIHCDQMWHNCVQEEEILELIPKITEWIQQRSNQ